MCLDIRTQNSIHPCEVPFSLGLEKLKDIGIDTQADGLFGFGMIDQFSIIPKVLWQICRGFCIAGRVRFAPFLHHAQVAKTSFFHIRLGHPDLLSTLL